MGFHSKTVCVVIDAGSTPYVSAFKGAGYPCIHISTKLSSVNPNGYSECLEFDGSNLMTILNKLKQYKVKCVVGGESGIELVDKLNDALKLPGNDSTLSAHRRQKDLMTTTAAQAGVETVPTLKATRVDDIILWAKRLNSKDPVVLKPVDSQSSDHVFFCHNEVEIRAAFTSITSTKNLFGKANEAVLAQKFNPGEEFIVTGVCWAKEVYIAEIWQVSRLPETTIYDRVNYLLPSDPRYIKLIAATKQVAKALGIFYGPITAEFKCQEEGVPTLLEATSRAMAGAPLSLTTDMFGYNQVTLTVAAYTDSKPDSYLSRACEQDKESIFEKRYAMAVALISDVAGVLMRNINDDNIKSLPTYNSYTISSEAGKEIDKTINALTSPGEIYLLGSSKEAVMADYAKIRALEQAGLYRDAIAILPAITSRAPGSLSTIFSPSSPPGRQSSSPVTIPGSQNRANCKVDLSASPGGYATDETTVLGSSAESRSDSPYRVDSPTVASTDNSKQDNPSTAILLPS